MLMAAAALLDRNPNPSDAEIDAAITNLCRCGTYPRVRAAIQTVAGELRAAPHAPPRGAHKAAGA
jgi:isoquinoline 1-oxidoreductase alpha subunit